MSADQPTPPPFYCPSCGKKHRADLGALRGAGGATAKVTCARCACVMNLRIGSDGLPTCEIHESPETKTATTAAAVATAAPGPLRAGGSMAKSSPLVPLLTAAVVAAVVSFLIVQVVGGPAPEAPASAPPAGDAQARIATLETQNAALQDRIVRLEAAAKHAASDTQAQLVVLGDRVDKLAAAADSLVAKATAAETAASELKDVKGRIEANYVNVRALTKRVETLESK